MSTDWNPTDDDLRIKYDCLDCSKTWPCFAHGDAQWEHR